MLYSIVITALVQLVEVVIEWCAPYLYRGLGVFLPLKAINCAILGASLFMVIGGCVQVFVFVAKPQKFFSRGPRALSGLSEVNSARCRSGLPMPDWDSGVTLEG